MRPLEEGGSAGSTQGRWCRGWRPEGKEGGRGLLPGLGPQLLPSPEQKPVET